MNPTLYLIQSCSLSTQNLLTKLKQIYSPQDHVVFMGESVALLNQTELDHFAQSYCLTSEHALLDPDLISNIKILDYTEFADLVLQFERCVSLK